MKKTFRISFFMVIVLALFSNCKHKGADKIVETEYNPHISAFTSGILSITSSIRVQLSSDYEQPIDLNKPVPFKVFSFSPKVKGEAWWIDQRTIEFRPDDRLKYNTSYEVQFELSKLKKVEDNFKTFKFHFRTRSLNVSVSVNGFSPYNKYNLTKNQITGTLLTSDFVDASEFDKMIEAKQGKQKLPVTWSHNGDGTEHIIVIDSVMRTEKQSLVEISWDGLETKGKKEIEIPALGDFKLMSHELVQLPRQAIRLVFSDPIDENQELVGLIRFTDNNTFTTSVENNTIIVYPTERIKGSGTLFLEEGIKNIAGYRFPTRTELAFIFETVQPEVKFNGTGVILPHSGNLNLPFSAVNLSAIDVKVIKIYENNVGYFLQVNHLDGEYQLKRAGKLILNKTIQLVSDKPIDYGKWNNFSLDLSTLINADAGAIYRIELGFKRKYSLYPCDSEELFENNEEKEKDDDNFESEVSYWDNYEDYSENEYYYDDDYNWEERNNPCSASYYGKRRSVAKNVVASNLGIIAKGGNSSEMVFAVTDLRTTKPIGDVNLKILDYQQQVISEVKTGKDGLARVTVSSKPFLLIASKDKERGYLRLDDGSSLSLSNFNVSGSKVSKGIKGFIYGERGVWRPGDTLFLTFILEDKGHTLPESHPVVFELRNATSHLVKKEVKTQSVNGFYQFSVPTQFEDQTGNWNVDIKVGGITFSKALKIETIKPNRLKINFDIGNKKFLSQEDGLNGMLKVNWLHGAVAKNMNARIDVALTSAKTTFKGYETYSFDDPARTFTGENKKLAEVTLNSEGIANVKSDINVSDVAPGMLKAAFTIKVFEESGDFSIDRFTIPYSPYSSYVGILAPLGDKRGMLLTDTLQTFKLVTLDEQGKPISRKNLEVNVYQVSWRWWWDASEDNLASYIGTSNTSRVFHSYTSTTNGKGDFKFNIKYPSWGRYLIRVTDPISRHITGTTVYFDWPGWAGRNRDNPDGASMLTFTTDKKTYSTGEMATVNFPSSKGSRALVSLESGSKVINAYWVEGLENNTSFNFRITEDMAPNIYVNLTLVQPHGQSDNDMPIRMYGVMPISVENPATKLHPVIKMPQVLKPGEVVTIKVSETNGKPMAYTVAIVDEGLLDLTRFATPDPWSTFYAHEALGIKTWDMYDMVLGAFGGKVEQLLSIGGDDEITNNKSGNKANRFKPMVKFIGPFYLSKGKTATHIISIPQYVGSVRTMVVAGYEGAYGSTEATTPVRKPLMVLATLPRVLGPQEEAYLPITVFAMENSIKNVTITVKGNEYFSFPEGNTKNITFNEIGDKVVYIPCKVTDKTGVGKISITVSGNGEKAAEDIEINIRNPNPPLTLVAVGQMEKGSAWTTEYVLPGMKGTNAITVEVSSMPPINLGKRLHYLITYPHGCLEQTTSSAFPQLFLKNIMDLDKNTKTEIEKNIYETLNRLRNMMLSDGGFGFWPEARSANDWGTSYAGHFILSAEKEGYTIPGGMKPLWLKYQKRAARDWSANKGKYQYSEYNQNDLEQAYRLYTLALAGEAEMGAMNRLREKQGLSNEAAWRLAATYALVGQKEAGLKIINNLPMEPDSYKGFSSTFGSDDRDLAMMLETLTLLDQKDKAISLMRKLSQQLSSEKWMSTQTTAYSLLAITSFAGKNKIANGLEFGYIVNGKKELKASSNLSLMQINLKESELNKTGKITINNYGGGTLFARTIMTGLPIEGNFEEISNNLEMTISYVNENDETISVDNIVQGTSFMAIVKVRNPGLVGDYSNMALTQIFPSGWEILTSRLNEDMEENKDTPDYMDIRDDRVMSYFDLSARKSKTFKIRLNAAYIGKFYLPPVLCSAMYNNDISARTTGKWVNVVKPE